MPSTDPSPTDSSPTDPPSGDDASPSGSTTGSGAGVRPWHVAGVVLGLAVGGLLLYGFWPTLTGQVTDDEDRPEVEASGNAATRIDAAVVQPTSFPLRTEATGHLRPWRRATLSAEVDGQVIERPVEEGQYVEEGRLLIRLDDRDERIALAEAEAELTKARAEYAVNVREAAPSAVADTSSAVADTSEVAAARRALAKARTAFDRGAISPEEVQAARRRFEAAQVRAGLRREAVQAATYGLTQAEQRVERARLELERTRIRAPFAGRVANLEVEVGQRVTPGQEVLTLLDDRPMKVTVDVLEEDLVRMREGATAQVHVPALTGERSGDADGGESAALPAPSSPAVVQGRVHAINPQVDPRQGTGRVTVAIPNSDGRLVAGLYATVRLETRRLEDRLVVPSEAVLVRQGRDLVFVVEGGRAQWTYVTVGARSGDHVTIAEGISPGDTVAVDGHFALAHDAPVEVGDVRTVSPE